MGPGHGTESNLHGSSKYLYQDEVIDVVDVGIVSHAQQPHSHTTANHPNGQEVAKVHSVTNDATGRVQQGEGSSRGNGPVGRRGRMVQQRARSSRGGGCSRGKGPAGGRVEQGGRGSSRGEEGPAEGERSSRGQ